jgi:hypothetical protein
VWTSRLAQGEVGWAVGCTTAAQLAAACLARRTPRRLRTLVSLFGGRLRDDSRANWLNLGLLMRNGPKEHP